jgi:hypothetical protein
VARKEISPGSRTLYALNMPAPRVRATMFTRQGRRTDTHGHSHSVELHEAASPYRHPRYDRPFAKEKLIPLVPSAASGWSATSTAADRPMHSHLGLLGHLLGQCFRVWCARVAVVPPGGSWSNGRSGMPWCDAAYACHGRQDQAQSPSPNRGRSERIGASRGVASHATDWGTRRPRLVTTGRVCRLPLYHWVVYYLNAAGL